MPKGQKDHNRVAVAPTVVLGCLNQPLDFSLRQVFAGPISGIGLAHRQSDCAFYVAWTDHFQVPNGRHFPPLHALYCAYIGRSCNSRSKQILVAGSGGFFRPTIFQSVRIRTWERFRQSRGCHNGNAGE
jgi:hypothetical protein